MTTTTSPAKQPSAEQQKQHSLAILDDYHGIAEQYYRPLFPDLPTTYYPDTLHPLHSAEDHAALITRLKPFSIISTMRERTPLPASIITQLPNLRLLLTTAPRNLGIDTAACASMNIVYCGTPQPTAGQPDPEPGQDMTAIAEESKALRSRNSATNEHTFALLLSLAKNIPADDYRLKAHPSGPWQTDLVTTLAGKVFGCVGLGRLGAQAAITAHLGFGMRVLCWSPNLTQQKADEVAARVGLKPGTFRVLGSKAEICQLADVLSLHLVLSDRSRGTFGAAELASMKKTALLINTSRGPLVDEAALLECCERGGIAGVALDVYDREPLAVDSGWRKGGPGYWVSEGRTRVVLSPHMGYNEGHTLHGWYELQAENLRRWLVGEEVLGRILPPTEEGGKEKI